MNVLLLSNSAPNYFHFFNALARYFSADGASVVVAVDSTFSKEENGLDTLGFDVYDFSEYYINHQIDRSILKKYSEFDLNGALLSDFERSEVYGIWGKRVDRNFYDKLKSALLSYFENIFIKHKIDFVLYENVSNTFSHIAFYVAQKQGARYCGIGGSRLPGRFSITSDPLEDKATYIAFHAIQSGITHITPDVRDWASQYLNNIENTVPDYMKFNGSDVISIRKRYLRFDRFKKIVNAIRHSFDNRQNAFQIGNPLRTHFNLFLRNVRRRLKIELVKKLYDQTIETEEFFLYPIHFHPESSTSILAGTYLNEYEVIRNIAFSLPEGMRLYVKDHISAWGYPSLDFYNSLKRLPNVRLLAPTAPTKKLCKASRGVITLTSTVGYEALLLKTRVYLYGRVFYEFHKGVTRIKDPTKLRALLLTGMDQDVDWDDDYNNDFICAYHQSTLPSSLNLMQDAKEADKLAKRVYTLLLSHSASCFTQPSL